MTIAASDKLVLGQPHSTVGDDLKTALLYAYTMFGSYRNSFDSVGVSELTIVEDDPLLVIERLPVIDSDALSNIALESLAVVDNIVDMETSSGTTGARKKRFISYEDDLRDHEFMADLFRVAGITTTDRVACLDTDPVYLMVSFTRALDLLGVEESYVYSVGRDYDRELNALSRLDPTAIFVVPSMFERCVEALRQHYATVGHRSLSKVVFIGERVPERLRSLLVFDWGLEVFSYYGAAEASSLGIECTAHNGIHLFSDRNFFELHPSDQNESDGQLVVTSLQQKTLPLVRYALGDEAVVKPGECPCGLHYPRVDVLGRAGDVFSILGSKFHYDSILHAAYKPFDEIGYLQILLNNDNRETLTLVLPKEMREFEKQVHTSLLAEQLEIDFLAASKYAFLQFEYVDDSHFFGSRKMKLVDDQRKIDQP
jgi:phenylacetate-CoA ligase